MNTIDARRNFHRRPATLIRSSYPFVKVLPRTNTKKTALQSTFLSSFTETTAISSRVTEEFAVTSAAGAGRDGRFAPTIAMAGLDAPSNRLI
jgi:hypothetical protein